MLIAFIVYDWGKPGGIEGYVRTLANIFSENNDIHIFTSNIGESKPDRITFHRISVPRGPFCLQLKLFSQRVKERIKRIKFDVVHNQGADGLVQDVITAHSCHRAWVASAKRLSSWELLKKTFNPLHWVILNNEKHNFTKGNYKKIIAVSPNVKNELLHYYGVSPEDVEVIFPGVDINEFSPKNSLIWRSRIRQEIGLEDDDFIILFVANEFRRKGLSALLTALAKINYQRVKLLVIGRGRAEPYRFVAKRLGINNRVIFESPKKYINRYFACADIFVLPTKYEPTGSVIMEAMASGIPTIVSKVAGVSAFLEDKNCMLNNPLDEEELAGKILFFVENRSYANEIGTKLRRNMENHTWDKVAIETYRIYEEVLRKKNAI